MTLELTISGFDAERKEKCTVTYRDVTTATSGARHGATDKVPAQVRGAN